MPQKINLILLVVLLIGAALVIYAFNFANLSGAKIIEFAGNIDKIENNTVFATGFFLENGKPIPGREDEEASIEIAVGSDTILTRLAIKIPEGESSFNIDDLEKEESPTDLQTISSDAAEHVVGVEADLSRGISKIKFKGRTLYFRVPIFNTEIRN